MFTSKVSQSINYYYYYYDDYYYYLFQLYAISMLQLLFFSYFCNNAFINKINDTFNLECQRYFAYECVFYAPVYIYDSILNTDNITMVGR